MLCDNLEECNGMGVAGKTQEVGTYVYFWVSHTVIWQKPTQYCKAISLQLQIEKILKRILQTLHMSLMSPHISICSRTD